MEEPITSLQRLFEEQESFTYCKEDDDEFKSFESLNQNQPSSSSSCSKDEYVIVNPFDHNQEEFVLSPREVVIE